MGLIPYRISPIFYNEDFRLGKNLPIIYSAEGKSSFGKADHHSAEGRPSFTRSVTIIRRSRRITSYNIHNTQL